MTREEGIAQIKAAEWTEDEYHTLILTVTDENGRYVHAFLTARPSYCDRGHLQLLVEGDLNLDYADSFPRFFFSFEEADNHTRTFLKWRLWKHRVYSHPLTKEVRKMVSFLCAMKECKRCGGQLKFANADNTDDCYPCECECHKNAIAIPEQSVEQKAA